MKTLEEATIWCKEQFKAMERGELEPELAREFIKFAMEYIKNPTFQRIFSEHMIDSGLGDEDDKNDGNDA